MSLTVTLQPSGRRFRVEHGETVLEAALRSGVSLNYKCINGTCGECRARIVEGELAAVAPHDFVLREADKRQGVVLLCRAVPATDLAIDALVARSPADIPRQTVVTRVERIDAVAPHVRLIQLRTPRSQTLRFLAGQAATLHIEGLRPSTRAIASCPCNGMFLEFHIRHDEGDAFARHVFDGLRVRDAVTVSGPKGRFTLDEESARPLLFLTHGTGFGPIKSLIEQALNLELPQPIRLYWTSSFAQGPYLTNYCRAWEDAFDHFRYIPLANEARDASPTELLEKAARRICAEQPRLDTCDLYAGVAAAHFGPARRVLLDAGLPPERLFIDTES